MSDADQQSGLGQSLANVLARTSTRRSPSEQKQSSGEIDIGLLRPPGDNPRHHFDEASLEELASSIRQHGLLQPVVVMRRGEGYEILAGERRWRAVCKLGWEKIPVVVRGEEDPRHIAELRLVENIQRENLNPIELAQAYRALIDDHELSHEELAVRLGKDRSSITNTLRLLQLPRAVGDDLANGRLSMGHAKALLGLPDAAAQSEVAQRAVEEGWSVRETERQCRQWGRATRGPSKPVNSAIRELEGNLYRLFGAPVKIKETGSGKGSVTISFTSKAHFQRVIEVCDQMCKESQRPGTSGE